MSPSTIEMLPKGRVIATVRLGSVSLHAHPAGVWLAGLDGDFGVRRVDGPWRRARWAFVPAGVRHALMCGDTLMWVLYLTPGRRAQQIFCAAQGIDGAAITVGEREGAAHAWAMSGRAAVDALPTVDFAASARVEGVARALEQADGRQRRLDDFARPMSITGSRLRHLFSQETGVSFRSVRRWYRLRAIAQHVAAGARLTEAAQREGFFDAAQLSRDFRAALGVPPSRVLRPRRQAPGSPERVGLP